jgi:hypothetical protein
MTLKKILHNVGAALACLGSRPGSRPSRPARLHPGSKAAHEALEALAARRPAAPPSGAVGDGLRPRNALATLQRTRPDALTPATSSRESDSGEIQPAWRPGPPSRRRVAPAPESPDGPFSYISLADVLRTPPTREAPAARGGAGGRPSYISLADVLPAHANGVHAAMSSVESDSEEAPPAPAPSPRRRTLLEAYQTQTHRRLDLARAVAAIKLRCAAEIHCDKNEWARFTPHWPQTRRDRQRFEKLIAMPVDELIADVQAYPATYSRTLLTDVAQHHLVTALKIDSGLFKKGLRKAGKYEGLHSVAGRVTTAAAAAASLGLSEIPGTGHALKAAQQAVKVLAHQLPANMINPMLTGKLRTLTDVKEAFKRVGGQPVVAPQIDNSRDMGAIVRMSRLRRRELRDAVAALTAAADSPQGLQQARGNVVDAFLALHDVVDREYRRRIGLNRTQTYSKGWGMAVNGVGAAGAVVTATVPVVGQIMGPAILAATIPLQLGAGYLDETRTKHWYNLRANTKWADFLTPDAARVHFKDLRPEHVSEAALRRSFQTQAEVQVAAIREVYEDELGDLMRQRHDLEQVIKVQVRAGKSVEALAPPRERLEHLETQFRAAQENATAFESFDLDRWNGIPPGSTLGRCLDDLKALERANRKARLRKPGETAQVVQRYVQAGQAGLSNGVALPVLDAITLMDRLYEHDTQGHQAQLQPDAEIGAVATGVTGGVVFTAATGEVRVSKAANKKQIAHLRVDPERFTADAARWAFDVGNRRVDLRNTDGYRRTVHSTWDEVKSIAGTIPGSLVSGPVGLFHLARAKRPHGELHKAELQLRAALDAMAASGAERVDAPGVRRARTLPALKDEFYDYPAVRAHLGVPPASRTPEPAEPGAGRTAVTTTGRAT